MTASRREREDPIEPRERRWVEVGKFLMLLCMAVAFFLLAHDMVRHHFFTGGYQNYRMGGGW